MDKLVENFLEKHENKRLLKEYLTCPTDFKREHLQTEFNEFFLQIKLLSYFSKSLHFLAQNIDKKNRDRNKKASLTLVDSDDYKSLQNIPDDKTLDCEILFDVKCVENYFKNKILYEVIAKLTLNQKKILYLFYIKSKSDKDIAQILGVSVQSINKQRNGVLTKKGEFKDGSKRCCSDYW